ncbi:divergent paired-related homeobox [Carlito syrichta]|uniref:Divergent paired-related homeobox n=1 Tax=Carlito syrichta TaxID=1868482 RepID=A0A1U7U047_CARSF|nr:divergent paired-related homeobox [Carlito syrichta]
MSGSEDLPGDKRQEHSHRKRTIFTKKQLEDLNVLFTENPYPSPSLQREMASQLDLPPTVLQVWFKNHRAKLKKEKCKPVQQKQTQKQHGPEGGVKTSPCLRLTDPQPRSPQATCPEGLVYTDHQTPSFQLIVCPNVKVPADSSPGHKIVHFGCCQDPNVYCLYPILEPQAHSPSCNPNSLGCSSLQSKERC